MLHSFDEHQTLPTAPARLPSPFENVPHPLGALAAEQLQSILRADNALEAALSTEGRMFAVLVVRTAAGDSQWLAAVSGVLPSMSSADLLVPPIPDPKRLEQVEAANQLALDKIEEQIEQALHAPHYLALIREKAQKQRRFEDRLVYLSAQRELNRAERKSQRASARERADEVLLSELDFASRQEREAIRQLRQEHKQKLDELNLQLETLETEIEALRTRYRRRAAEARRQRFDCYALVNFLGQPVRLRDAYQPSPPPDGSGDCAEPRLLHYAALHGLQPLAMASFWWGASPKAEVRHSGRFYPACRGRCAPLLPVILQGVATAPPPRMALEFGFAEPSVIYEDDVIVVVDKPSGMLSVPGKRITDSVVTRLQSRVGDAATIMAVHRLDMSTSGVMLLAKSHQAFVHLQKQFSSRSVKKRYEAILDGLLTATEGEIALPLRTDFDDRPRQLICQQHGKPALTHWKTLRTEGQQTRVALYPHTGRTHQLRLHAAHADGLGVPILGDELYGRPGCRLHLHAAELVLRHPTDGRVMQFRAPVPF